MSNQIRYNDRLLFCGKTGSGKTWLARQLCRPLSRLVVIDGKGQLTGSEGFGTVDYNPKAYDALMKGEPARIRFPIPPGVDAQDWLEPYFMDFFEVGNLTIYIDEIYSIAPPRSITSPWFDALYQRGRSYGIGVWASTQRPVFLPPFILSETEWFVLFRLTRADDRARMVAMMGTAVRQPVPDRYGFWLYHISWNSPRYFRKASLQFKDAGAGDKLLAN